MSEGPSPNPTVPLAIAAALVVAGVVLAAIHGLAHGSIGGGILAALGLVPACYAAWQGMQKETQGSLGMALLMVFVSLGAGGLLIVLGIIHWLHG